MSKVVFNKSKTYLVPLMSEFVNFNSQLMPNMVNSYISKQGDNSEDLIHILIEFDLKDLEFTKYEKNLINNDLFVEMTDIDKFVLYTFKFPKEYMGEYTQFKNSKLSKFGNDAKEIILKFWGGVYSGNQNAIPILLKIKQILYKEEKLRKEIEERVGVKIAEDAELGELLDESNETFKLKEWDIINEKKLL